MNTDLKRIADVLEHLAQGPLRAPIESHEDCVTCSEILRLRRKPEKKMKRVLHDDKSLKAIEADLAQRRMMAGPEIPEHDSFRYRERGE